VLERARLDGKRCRERLLGLLDEAGEVLPERLAGDGEHGGREPRLDHRLLVGEVEHEHVVRREGDGSSGDTDDRGGACPGGDGRERFEALARGPGAADDDDTVVGTRRVPLRRVRGIGLAEPGVLPEDGDRLGDERARPAPEHEDALAGCAEHGAGGGPAREGLGPHLGLAVDLSLGDGARAHVLVLSSAGP
jgi:hypothetical protein